MATSEVDEADRYFMSLVIIFHQDYGDVTRSVAWDEARCERLMPAFFAAYKQWIVAKDVLDRVASSYKSLI